MVYLVQSLYTYVFLHCPATGMQNGDEASQTNSLAGRTLLVKMLITLDRMVYFVQILNTYVFKIVQQLVCTTVTRLRRASFWPVKLSK